MTEINFLGYTVEDIEKVLQRAYDETLENRNRALKLYDHMESAMLNNKGDLVILSQMADRYLEQATRQTELLVRLVGVMQKLKQFDKNTDKKEEVQQTITSFLESLDKHGITPFSLSKRKVVEKTEPTETEKKKGPEPETETDL